MVVGLENHSQSTEALSWPEGAAGLVLPQLLGHMGPGNQQRENGLT